MNQTTKDHPQDSTHERITKTLKEREKSCLVASLYRRVPLQRKLNKLINKYSESESGDERDYFRMMINSTREEIKGAHGDGHPNPEWLLATLDGNIAFTFGDLQEALRNHRKALKLVSEQYQEAISLANVSDTLRRLGQYPEAIQTALDAVEIDPGNEGFWAYLSMALFKAGEISKVSTILREASSRAKLANLSDVWRNYLLSYPEFQEMRDEGVPEIEHLFEQIER